MTVEEGEGGWGVRNREEGFIASEGVARACMWTRIWSAGVGGVDEGIRAGAVCAVVGGEAPCLFY